ncbi:MAG: exodeoxyribonuclease VII small subunit [Prevotellaceae bacterium]|nr:exodeoxyribonuclease VII small subunit [Prevotellaceae bacterium]MDD7108681.1 exodeoxyribonuclease VII small subunit [Prevotellaceae bacterium]
MKKEFCYEEAVERLEKIVAEMEDSHQDIDHLIDRLKEAKGLIKQCKEKLYKIDKAIKELEEEDEE